MRFGKKIKGIKIAENPNIQKISLESICGSVTGIGFTKAVKPSTEAILNMFEPIKLPNEIAFSCLAAAITEAANSGP